MARGFLSAGVFHLHAADDRANHSRPQYLRPIEISKQHGSPSCFQRKGRDFIIMVMPVAGRVKQIDSSLCDRRRG
jgi:hypothetical protein